MHPLRSCTHLLLGSLLAALVACGGGDSATTPPPPPPPPPPPTPALFTDASATNLPGGLISSRCMDVQPVDYDSDGDQDLILAIEFGSMMLWRNDGNAVFSNAAAGMLANAADHEDIALADLDGDLDLDFAVAAEDTALHEYYIDDGTTFLGTNLVDSSVANAVVAFDVDADGSNDIVFGGTSLLVLINDGSGAFSVDPPGRFPVIAGVVQDLVAVDVDNDGDLDLALGNEGQNQLFLNQGGGVYTNGTATHLPAVNDETRLMAFADVDGDGDLDLYVGNVLQELASPALQDFLYANDGAGHVALSPSLVPPGAFNTYGGHFVDFDADGDQDLVAAHANILDGDQLIGFKLYRNNGTGTLADATTAAFGGPVLEHGFGVAAADFDGDLDIDLYLCARGAASSSGFIGRNDHLMLQD